MRSIARKGLVGLVALSAATHVSYSSAQSGLAITEVAGDSTPRYQVEVILFAHEDFDPNEELLTGRPLQISKHRPAALPRQRYLDALMRLEIRQQVDAPILISGRPAANQRPFPSQVLALEAFSIEETPLLDFRLLDDEELQLNAAYSRINRLSAYRALLHGGWVQEALPEDEAIAFDIAELLPLGVRGTIRLHVSRFLHVTVDLSYRPPGGVRAEPAFAAPEPRSFDTFEAIDRLAPADRLLTEIELPPAYHLTAQRRILRGELNYLDHPAFGLVIQITLEPEPELPIDEIQNSSGPAA